jgi:hypothetical protein
VACRGQRAVEAPTRARPPTRIGSGSPSLTTAGRASAIALPELPLPAFWIAYIAKHPDHVDAQPVKISGQHGLSGQCRLPDQGGDDFARCWRDFVEFVEASEPRLIAFNAYVNEEGNEVAIVQYIRTETRWSST